LRKDTYWADHNAEVTKAIVSRSIAQLMHFSKKYIPTSKSTAWNYPKFHELMHIVDDISQFGAPQNFCAQRPESLLIVAAKQPGRRAQKRHRGVVYELQVEDFVHTPSCECIRFLIILEAPYCCRIAQFVIVYKLFS
jgi:hypothetical protein